MPFPKLLAPQLRGIKSFHIQNTYRRRCYYAKLMVQIKKVPEISKLVNLIIKYVSSRFGQAIRGARCPKTGKKIVVG